MSAAEKPKAKPAKKRLSDIRPATKTRATTPATPAVPTNDEPVIYLEADEEITAATSRMLATSSDEVRIVVPKRSTLLQSVVNQKLLKRAADNAGKSLVLVTSDRTASHLAAQVGIPVAASVKADADIPESQMPEQADVSDTIEAATEVAAVAAVAKAAGSPKPSYAQPMSKSQPKVNNPFVDETEATPEAPAADSAKVENKKQKASRRVPSFDTLQKRIFIIAGVLIALVAVLVGQYYLKHAVVTLYAKGELIDVNTNFKVDANADSVSITSSTIPGKKYETTSQLTGTTPATGTKDVGTKASGSMTIKNSYDSSSHTFVAGTRFQSSSGKMFVSTESVTVPGGSLSGGHIVAGTASVNVQAAENGDSYNLAPTSYTLPGLPSSQQSTITGTGGQMSGGTTKEIKVVSQTDIDKAKNDAIDKDKAGKEDELKKKAENSIIMPDSFTATASDVSASPALDAEAENVTVKFTVTYSLLSVKKDDLSTLITAIEQKQIGSGKQIYQDGVDNAQITAKDGNFNFVSTASAGQKIDTAALLTQIKGQRSGAAIDLANKTAGVSHAEVTLSPSWSVKLPSITDHIDIQIKLEQQADTTK